MIIEDRMMYGYGFINSAKNLQLLLEKLNSWLEHKKIGTEEIPFSEWLCGLCQHYEIEPLYILALIQKEQSGVEKEPTDRGKDWILGFGCPESGERFQQFKGFDRQIPNALKQFGKYEGWEPIRKWKTTPVFLYDPSKKLPIKRGPQFVSAPNPDKKGEVGIGYQPESKAEAMSYLYNPRYEGVSNLGKIWRKYFAIAKENGLIIEVKRTDGLV